MDNSSFFNFFKSKGEFIRESNVYLFETMINTKNNNVYFDDYEKLFSLFDHLFNFCR
jgi:hypothetical protein